MEVSDDQQTQRRQHNHQLNQMFIWKFLQLLSLCLQHGSRPSEN